MMLRESLIRAVVLCFMAAGMAYVSADAAVAEAVGSCSDLDFTVCMDGWACEEETDCQGVLDLAGPEYAHCEVADAQCGWHLFCLGSNPRLKCTYSGDH
jgi:hypothetical protein